MSKARISWARLLQRVFNIDDEGCDSCGGKAKIIGAIEDPRVIRDRRSKEVPPSMAGVKVIKISIAQAF